MLCGGGRSVYTQLGCSTDLHCRLYTLPSSTLCAGLEASSLSTVCLRRGKAELRKPGRLEEAGKAEVDWPSHLYSHLLMIKLGPSQPIRHVPVHQRQMSSAYFLTPSLSINNLRYPTPVQSAHLYILMSTLSTLCRLWALMSWHHQAGCQ